MWPWLWLIACTAPDVARTNAGFPAPDAWGPLLGPGGPSRTLDPSLTACAYLLGGDDDAQHHNLVGIRDGLLVMPWAPEDGGGGVSFFAFDDPCAPTLVGEAWSDTMRETHTLAFSEVDDRTYLAVAYHEERTVGGIGIWDVTDPRAPFWVSDLATPGYTYPDAYFHVVLGIFWQGPWMYAAQGFDGILVIDASDPTDPVLVNQVVLDTPHLAGSFTVVGNLAMSASAGLARAVMMDVSDPVNPTVIPGGDIQIVDAEHRPVGYYFATLGGEYGLFARNADGGGPVVVDLTDPSAPAQLGAHLTPDGDGGYVFRHEDHLFQGDSNFGSVYDLADPTAPIELGRFQLAGDLDTVTPIGNVAVVSVDAGAEDGQSSAVMPWRAEPDRRGPMPKLTSPADGAVGQALTSRIGVSFDEQIEGRSAFPGSFRVVDDRGRAVSGTFNVQEGIVNFTPDAPLEPATTYRVALPAGGIADVSGNPIEETFSFAFSTR